MALIYLILSGTSQHELHLHAMDYVFDTITKLQVINTSYIFI